jgi:hypothetical protein
MLYTRAMRWRLLALLAVSCAVTPEVGRGGPVYEVIVDSINGRATGNKGPASYPALTLQVGSQVERVWLAANPVRPEGSPAIMKADAAALKAGILVERDWRSAVVRRVTDAELAVGAAVVYIPSVPEPIVVELRFRPVGGAAPR